MSALRIRDLPADIHRVLVERARKARRTIAQEATVLLMEALAVSPQERRRTVLVELGRSRKRFDFTRITPPEELIRADRNR